VSGTQLANVLAPSSSMLVASLWPGRTGACCGRSAAPLCHFCTALTVLHVGRVRCCNSNPRAVTEMEGFNSHLNMEQMNKALISLNDMYNKLAAAGRPAVNGGWGAPFSAEDTWCSLVTCLLGVRSQFCAVRHHCVCTLPT